jgi:sterol desaturase/sphingolipid hydroxylase (fatty acid hydroxylase superfamily)
LSGDEPQPPGEPSPETESDTDTQQWRLWDHIGVISGVTLGVIALGFLLFVSLAGDPAAFAIVVTVVIGTALIFVGGQMHGRRR